MKRDETRCSLLGTLKYIPANMNYVYDISIKRHLIDLSIDIFVFKIRKLKAV